MAETKNCKTPRRGLNLPNTLTVLRILLVPVFGYLLYVSAYTQSYGQSLAALIIYCVAAITDQLDGYLARAYGMITDFGKIMDPIADKALMITAFVIMTITDALFWWFTLVVIIREIAVTALRWWLLRKGTVLPASSGGKAKTVLQMLVAFLIMMLRLVPSNLSGIVTILSWVTIVSILAAFVVTALSGLDYFLGAYDASKGRHRRKRHKRGSRLHSLPMVERRKNEAFEYAQSAAVGKSDPDNKTKNSAENSGE